jgi:hypothetical protein
LALTKFPYFYIQYTAFATRSAAADFLYKWLQYRKSPMYFVANRNKNVLPVVHMLKLFLYVMH